MKFSAKFVMMTLTAAMSVLYLKDLKRLLREEGVGFK